MSSRLLMTAVMAALALSLHALPAPPAGTRLALEEQLQGAARLKDKPGPVPAKPGRGGIDCTTGIACPMIWAPRKK
ncbi:MAG: hypothetical protein JSS20_09475 [Proteobacteria bacterium]|nr:hypothetical protein [Pseudomonadota bacterium]